MKNNVIKQIPLISINLPNKPQRTLKKLLMYLVTVTPLHLDGLIKGQRLRTVQCAQWQSRYIICV